ncbi:MAG: hypothetical protein LBN20_03075, partial [Endomicrobium sp.]|nr:hypothetical protein [Endomicrobium sp.]
MKIYLKNIAKILVFILPLLLISTKSNGQISVDISSWAGFVHYYDSGNLSQPLTLILENDIAVERVTGIGKSPRNVVNIESQDDSIKIIDGIFSGIKRAGIEFIDQTGYIANIGFMNFSTATMGGAMFLDNRANYEFRGNINFSSNSAAGSGGAIYSLGTLSSNNADIKFIYNSAASSGGALSLSGSANI